ncbi:MAG: hypothetical protein QM820_35510 [Minicystis sp.]
MSSPVEGQPYVGPHYADITALMGKLIDLPRGAMSGLRAEQPGMTEVITELEGAAPTLPAVAEPYAEFVQHTATIAQIRAARVIVDKMAEVLEESEAKYTHERENALSMIVDAVKSSAKRKTGAGLLAAFEDTIAYVAQAALKAAQTRKKNAEAKKDAAKNG